MIITFDIKEEKFDFDLLSNETNQSITFDIEAGKVNPKQRYDGDYEITPKISETVLHTRQKFMTDDVTIFQIPFSSVTNEQGGQTVTIGIE